MINIIFKTPVECGDSKTSIEVIEKYISNNNINNVFIYDAGCIITDNDKLQIDIKEIHHIKQTEKGSIRKAAKICNKDITKNLIVIYNNHSRKEIIDYIKWIRNRDIKDANIFIFVFDIIKMDSLISLKRSISLWLDNDSFTIV